MTQANNLQQKIPRYLLYLTTFLIPFYFFRFSFLGLKTNILELFVFLSLLTTILFVPGNKKFYSKNFLLPLLLLLIVFIVAIFSPDRTKALGIFKGWFLAPIIFAWLIRVNFNSKNIRPLFIPVFVSLLLISIWAILQKIGIIGASFYQVGDSSFTEYLKEGRAFGPFESPNYLAMYLVPSFFLSIPVLGLIEPKRYKILFYLSLLLPVLALVFAESRAGFFAIVIAGLVYLNYRFINKEKAKNRRPFFSILFVVLLLVINFSYLLLASKFIQTNSASDNVRIEIYHYAIDLVRYNPITGVGLGNFQNKVDALSLTNASFREYGLQYALHPHNLLLAFWLNLGLAGLILFLALLVVFFQNSFNSDSYLRPVILAGMVAILTQGLFDTTYFKNDLATIFWLLFSLSLIIKNQNEDLKKSI